MTKKHKVLLWSISIFLFVVAATFGSLFTYQRAYAQKIYRNVYFTNIDLSGKTKKQAEFLIKKEFDSVLHKEIIFQANDKTVKATYEDVGLSFDIAQVVNDSYQYGRSGKFFSDLLAQTKTAIYVKKAVTGTPYVDTAKFENFKTITLEQLNTTVSNASLKIENGEVVLTAAVNGQSAVLDNIQDQVVTTLEKNESLITVESTITLPEIKDGDFSAAKTQAESYINRRISFSYDSKTYSPSKTDIGFWIYFQQSGDTYLAQLNDSSIKAYLNKIGHNFEVKKVDQKVKTSTGEVIDPGKTGVYIDKDLTLATLKSQLSASGEIKIAMTVTTEAPGVVQVTDNIADVETGKFAGKYIDINLSKQQLCQIESLVVVACHTISSGKPSTPTPPGTYTILGKNPRAWGAAYGLWMPWYQEFRAGGYALHELPEWPNGYKEGQDHLGTPVSHGCVRMGVGEAEIVYNWTEIGTPVYIH